MTTPPPSAELLAPTLRPHQGVAHEVNSTVRAAKPETGDSDPQSETAKRSSQRSSSKRSNWLGTSDKSLSSSSSGWLTEPCTSSRPRRATNWWSNPSDGNFPSLSNLGTTLGQTTTSRSSSAGPKSSPHPPRQPTSSAYTYSDSDTSSEPDSLHPDAQDLSASAPNILSTGIPDDRVAVLPELGQGGGRAVSRGRVGGGVGVDQRVGGSRHWPAGVEEGSRRTGTCKFFNPTKVSGMPSQLFFP